LITIDIYNRLAVVVSLRHDTMNEVVKMY